MISLKQYITSDGKYPNFANTWLEAGEHDKLEEAAKALLIKVNVLLATAGIDAPVSSGWRPAAHNFAIGGSQNSKHIFAQAVDLWDPDKRLGEWCMDNQQVLKELGLYMESLSTTHAAANRMKRWVHAQTVAPRSGKTVFIP